MNGKALGGAETGPLPLSRSRPNLKASDEAKQSLPCLRSNLKASDKARQSLPRLTLGLGCPSTIGALETARDVIRHRAMVCRIRHESNPHAHAHTVQSKVW